MSQTMEVQIGFEQFLRFILKVNLGKIQNRKIWLKLVLSNDLIFTISSTEWQLTIERRESDLPGGESTE